MSFYFKPNLKDEKIRKALLNVLRKEQSKDATKVGKPNQPEVEVLTAWMAESLSKTILVCVGLLLLGSNQTLKYISHIPEHQMNTHNKYVDCY